MLRIASEKYDAFPKLSLPDRKWPERSLTRPPRWLSTDLRDGNQALVQPMDGDAKFRYFRCLAKLGYKEIEVSYPSASNTEYDFTRRLITTPRAIPDDVWIQVLTPCREELIRTTVKAVRDAKRVILHLYIATSELFRNTVLNKTEEEIIDTAVRCTNLIRTLTKDSVTPEYSDTEWLLEFSPENFQDTSPAFVLRICDAIKKAWGPSKDRKIIFNLPSTVEMAMPNIYADQVEYFSENISEREKVCVSVHTHNDRGCAVAAAEMGLLAGADRVEGCLFGNGERTGNVDLVTLALNLYTQGVHPGIDFSDLGSVIAMVEELTQVPVHSRAPYAGSFTYQTFAGTHQDAIRKGYRIRASKAKELGRAPKWVMPYLPLDPADVGRIHESVIRINSQSGKGGIAWCIDEIFGIELPAELGKDFTKVVQAHTDDAGVEVTADDIRDLFETHYMLTASTGVQVLSCSVDKVVSRDSVLSINGSHLETEMSTRFNGSFVVHNLQKYVSGVGSELITAILDALRPVGSRDPILDLVGEVAELFESPTKHQHNCSILKLRSSDKAVSWGVSIHANPTWALFEATLKASINLEKSSQVDLPRGV